MDPELFDIIEKEKNRQWKVGCVSVLLSLGPWRVMVVFQEEVAGGGEHAEKGVRAVLLRGWSSFPVRTL